jgi:hypothetical protein
MAGPVGRIICLLQYCTAMRLCGSGWNQTKSSSDDRRVRRKAEFTATSLAKRSWPLRHSTTHGKRPWTRGRVLPEETRSSGSSGARRLAQMGRGTRAGFALDGLWASAKSRQLGRRRPCAGRLCVRFSAEDEGCIGSTEAERIGHRVLGGHCKGLITYDFETARVIDLAQVRRWWSDLVSQRENR